VKEHAVLVIDEETTFTSPLGKLARFFRGSRDGWKEKCRTAKAALKRLKNEAYALRKSRDEWKVLAKQQEQELKQLRRELEEQKLRIG
jgi:hypothetical protein